MADQPDARVYRRRSRQSAADRGRWPYLQAYRHRHPARRVRDPDDRRSDRLPVRAGRPTNGGESFVKRQLQPIFPAELADYTLQWEEPVLYSASFTDVDHG